MLEKQCLSVLSNSDPDKYIIETHSPYVEQFQQHDRGCDSNALYEFSLQQIQNSSDCQCIFLFVLPLFREKPKM